MIIALAHNSLTGSGNAALGAAFFILLGYWVFGRKGKGGR